MPPRFVFDGYSPGVLNAIIELQKAIIEGIRSGEWKGNPYVVIIFDDGEFV